MVTSCYSPCGHLSLVGGAWFGAIDLSLVIAWAEVWACSLWPGALCGHVTRLPQGRARISFKNHNHKCLNIQIYFTVILLNYHTQICVQQWYKRVCVLPLRINRDEDFGLMWKFSSWERPGFFLDSLCRATSWAMCSVSLHTPAKHIT